MEIETTSGQTYVRRVEHPHGHPLNPISRDSLRAKFVDCSAYGRQAGTAEELTGSDELDR